MSLCDSILTLPVNPAFASLNLATAVAVTAYEWSKAATGNALPFAMPERSPPADRVDLFAFFDHVERELEEAAFFRSPEKAPSTTRNIRNIFHRCELTKQDLATLHGMITALVEGREGREQRKAERNAKAAAKRIRPPARILAQPGRAARRVEPDAGLPSPPLSGSRNLCRERGWMAKRSWPSTGGSSAALFLGLGVSMRGALATYASPKQTVRRQAVRF